MSNHWLLWVHACVTLKMFKHALSFPLLVVLGLCTSCLVLLIVECCLWFNITLCTSDRWWCLARMNDKLRMFKHPLSLFVSFHVCAPWMHCTHAFIDCFLLQQGVCSHCLYWGWLKVRSVHTMCSLMQHYIEMPRPFGTELRNMLAYMHMKE